MTAPLCIDLFCGLGGWAKGFIAEGYKVIGFDLEVRPYPGELVIQNVRTLHGSQFKKAAIIVASPPCQEYSYRAMPWKRVKTLPSPSNELFEACFRIQREACTAASHHIPLIVENVRGAQKWIGPARWHFGSYYLWGDVPALMPFPAVRKSVGGKWSQITRSEEGLKYGGGWWHDPTNDFVYRTGSKSAARKAASASIAEIPLSLARHMAQCFQPDKRHYVMRWP